MAKSIDARVNILADTADLERGMRRSIAATDKFNRSTKRVNRNPFRSVTRSVAGLAGAYIGAQGLITVVQGAVREQQESIKVGRQTNAVLKSTKNAAGLSAKAIENLAGALSRKTGIDDEAIQSAENLLLTFTKIGKDTFPAATAAVLDLSAGMGMSLKGASVQVGKALQDPIRGVNALRRSGVSFSTEQTEVIKKLVETGKTAEAQRLILKELETQFGGSAEAQATPFEKLRVTYEDLLETLGGYLVPVLNDVAEATIKFVEQFRAGEGAGGQFRDTLKGIHDTLRPIAQLLINHPQLVAGAAAAYIAFKATLAALNLFTTLMVAFGTVAQYAAAGRVRGAAFATSVKVAVAGLGKIGTVGLIIGGLFAVEQYGPAIDKWQKGLSDKITAQFPSFKTLGSDLLDVFANAGKKGPMPSFAFAIKGARALAKMSRGGFVSDGKALIASLSKGVSGAASSVGRAVSGAVAKGKAAASNAVGSFRNIGSNIVNAMASGIRGSFNAVKSAAQDLANALPGWAKKVLGIDSPSKVFAEIGENLVAGMALGMSRTAPLVKAAGKMVKAATPSAAAAFGLGAEAGDAEALLKARRKVTDAADKKARDKAARALAALEAKQAARQARATAGETLKGFIAGILDQIRQTKLDELMAPVNAARAARAERETSAARGGLQAGITRAQAELLDPRVQARYQRDAARLDARIAQARKSGNLEALDALQSEKDALDARYGPAYLAGLQDQLDQLNENEIEASSEAAATAFANTFAAGMQSALDALLAGGSVEAFFAQLQAAMAGSGVSPGAVPPSVAAGAGEAAAALAPAPLLSRIIGFLRGKDKKKQILASAIAKGIQPQSTKSAVYKITGKEFRGYKIANRASGGMLTPGMLTMVGETGPELIVGGKVHSATRTNRMGSGQGMNITVNAYGAAGNDPQLLARELGWQLATR